MCLTKFILVCVFLFCFVMSILPTLDNVLFIFYDDIDYDCTWFIYGAILTGIFMIAIDDDSKI